MSGLCGDALAERAEGVLTKEDFALDEEISEHSPKGRISKDIGHTWATFAFGRVS